MDLQKRARQFAKAGGVIVGTAAVEWVFEDIARGKKEEALQFLTTEFENAMKE